MNAKYVCSFCKGSNTKMEDVTQHSGGIFGSHRKVGEREVIDKHADSMMRCSNYNCGKILHEKCLKKLGSKKGRVFKSLVCPNCESKMVRL